ncbi:type VI secretion system tip protein VgrG, partial [Methylomagnum sp.]
MPESPLSNAADVISCKIFVGGEQIPDTYLVRQIYVHKEVNRIPTAKIVLIDGSSAEETFAISESGAFLPGKAVEIKLGYLDQLTTIFKGIVVKHGIRVRGGGNSSLVVSCMDKAVLLTLGRKSTLFLKKKDSDIIDKLIKGQGLESDVAATAIQHEELVRYYATDWDFIVSRAEANGQIVIVDDGKVSVTPPKVSGAAGLVIRHGDALRELDAEIDARSQPPAVKSASWDFTSQSAAAADSKEPGVNAQGNLTGKDLAGALGLAADELKTSAPLARDELTEWASARLLKSRLARIRGTVSFQGNAAPKPGQIVELAGLGARFNGNAFVSGVDHAIEAGQWVTTVAFGLSPRWFAEEHPDIEAPSAAGLMPGIEGLHLGTVKQIQEDPDGQTRILVDVPLLDSDGGDGIWARFASPYATQDAGMLFLPEVGDEVVLGFINGDPRFPVVLGSLYSSSRNPPYTPDADNTHKAIVTKGKVKIGVDDVKKIVRIETPGGHKFTLDDEAATVTLVDSNNNKVELASGGITLNSASDITIKAGGGIKIEASTGINAKAGTD